jgi:hypothetical protein
MLTQFMDAAGPMEQFSPCGSPAGNTRNENLGLGFSLSLMLAYDGTCGSSSCHGPSPLSPPFAPRCVFGVLETRQTENYGAVNRNRVPNLPSDDHGRVGGPMYIHKQVTTASRFA